GAIASHGLLLPLALVGRGVVADVRRGSRRRRLVRRARAGVDVTAGDRDGRVGVHGVLLAVRDAERELLGLGLLNAELSSAGTAAAHDAGVAASDVLLLRLALVGGCVVADVRGGRGVGGLRRRARAGVDVAARDRDRHVRVDGVLVALRD